MKNKFGLLFVCCLLLVGCNDNSNNNINDLNDKIEVSEEAIKIASDDKRLVFKRADDNYLVFDYTDDKITGAYLYLSYDSPNSAKSVLDIIKVNYKDDETVEEITRNAQYIIIKYNEEYIKEYYENVSISQLGKMYADLKEVKE